MKIQIFRRMAWLKWDAIETEEEKRAYLPENFVDRKKPSKSAPTSPKTPAKESAESSASPASTRKQRPSNLEYKPVKRKSAEWVGEQFIERVQEITADRGHPLAGACRQLFVDCVDKAKASEAPGVAKYLQRRVRKVRYWTKKPKGAGRKKRATPSVMHS